MAKENLQEKDQSMEEILQSIKRIIAEEGEEEPAPMAMDSNVKGSSVLDLEEFEEIDPGQPEILELTETMDSPAPRPRQPQPPMQNRAEPNGSPNRDVLADIDSLLSDETVRASTAALKALSEAQAPSRGARDVTRASTPFRNGGTVEDLVVEALRPMLKDWLDQHLPVIVRELVAKEIKKLSH